MYICIYTYIYVCIFYFFFCFILFSLSHARVNSRILVSRIPFISLLYFFYIFIYMYTYTYTYRFLCIYIYVYKYIVTYELSMYIVCTRPRLTRRSRLLFIYYLFISYSISMMQNDRRFYSFDRTRVRKILRYFIYGVCVFRS